MSTLWTRLPVSMLTIRQFSGGRTVRLAVLLSCIPALFAALFVFRPWESSADGYLTDLFRELIVPTLLPIVILLPATAAFGDELEDNTLQYLFMKPVSRLRLVLGKYLAILAVTIPALLLGLGLTALIVSQGPNASDTGLIFRAMAGAAVMSTVLLGGVFLLVSLLVPRALLAGMIYIFAWESLLGRFLPGVRSISSREYTIRVFDAILADDGAAARYAALTMLVVAVVCLAIAVVRLRQMQLD